MGTGIGENSPVILTLGKENYEALISRHGQWVRWRVATKCSCIKTNSMQPDIHCKKCGGLGIVYGYQKSKTITSTVMVKDNSGILEFDSEYTNCPLVKVYDNSGIIYKDAQKIGNFINLNTSTLPGKGVYVTAVMTETILQNLKTADTESVGCGYYRVKGLQSNKNNIDGLYHTAPADIISIGSVHDVNDRTYTVKELRQDCFFIERQVEMVDDVEVLVPIAEPVTVENVEYIPPFTFVLLNQNISKSDAQVMQELNGDAVLTFPYNLDVSNDDVITVLSGTYTQKSVIAKKEAAYDVIAAYFVDEVVFCVGTEREYFSSVDFILVGDNRLKWLCEDAPENGDVYSITYKVYPTYKVVKAIPQIRTSENQRMPKKAIVKLYDTYGEKRGINKQ